MRSARRKGRPNAPACEHGHLARKLRVLEERLGVIESTIGLEEPLKVIRIA